MCIYILLYIRLGSFTLVSFIVKNNNFNYYIKKYHNNIGEKINKNILINNI